MWYVHFSLDLDLVACCVDWQRPQVGKIADVHCHEACAFCGDDAVEEHFGH